jgi:hypothetical protein
MQSPDNMPEQAWTDTPPLPVNQGIGEQPASATPVQQPYNIFRNIQLPNVSVSGTNRMNVGSVVPPMGEPSGQVQPLSTWQTMGNYKPMWGAQPTEASSSEIPNDQQNVPNGQPYQYIQPWEKVERPMWNTQVGAEQPQQNPQGVSVVSPIAEPTGNGKVPYVDAFNQLQEQKKKEVPTSKDGGKGLTNWIKNNLGGDGTKEGNRRAVQNIIALGNMLRHAANLRGTIHEATPQQIADQNAINEAKWKQDDALEQAQAEKQREWQRKVDKDKADAEDKAFNRNMAVNNYNLKLADQARQRDKDAADKAYKEGQAKLAAERAALDKEKFEELKKQHGLDNELAQQKLDLDRARVGIAAGNLALSRAKFNEQQSKAKSGKFKDKNGKEHKGKVYTTPQGATYTLSDSFLTGENVRKMYYKLPESIRNKDEYKLDADATKKSGTDAYNTMLNAVLYGAGDNKPYHDYFVYQGERLGYNYIGGMSDADYAKLIGKPRKTPTLTLK